MKLMKVFALTVGMSLLLFSSILAQGPNTLWTKTFGFSGDDDGWSVQQTYDGGYIVAGYTQGPSMGDYDVYIIKTNQNGDSLWTRILGGVEHEGGYSVLQTSDKGYIITGETRSFGAGLSDVYFIKIDSLGDTLWTRTYGGTDSDEGFSVDETFDGGYIISGLTYSFTTGDTSDVYLVRTDSSGSMLWEKTYNRGTGDCIGYSVKQTSDKGYIVVGEMEYSSGHEDVYLIKTDSLGDTLWTRTYGGGMSDPDHGHAIQQTSDGGYIIAGKTWSYSVGGYDVYIIKTDSVGLVEWEKTYGGLFWDIGYSVQQTNDGGYIVGGWTDSFGAGWYDFYLIKTDSLGDTLWAKTYGGASVDQGYSVQQTLDGGYIMTGYTRSFGVGLTDVYLVKTEPDPTYIKEKSDQIPSSRDSKFMISPNPFMTTLSIEVLNTSEHQNTRSSELHIYDASGRLVKSVKLETSTYQLGTDLIPGIYFLKLNGKPVGKVVKVR